MLDIEKSDSMICNNRTELAFKYNRMNERLAMQQFRGTLPVEVRSIDGESAYWRGMSTRTYCNDLINSRGTNANKPCIDKTPCSGYDCYTPFHLSDFTLIPCKENTFRNFIDCDDSKCCSVHHQLFMNLTKRNGIEMQK